MVRSPFRGRSAIQWLDIVPGAQTERQGGERFARRRRLTGLFREFVKVFDSGRRASRGRIHSGQGRSVPGDLFRLVVVAGTKNGDGAFDGPCRVHGDELADGIPTCPGTEKTCQPCSVQSFDSQ
jgi:hypothetical protein